MGRDCEIIDGSKLAQPQMRVQKWLVFYQLGEGGHILNSYVRASSAQEALETAKAWGSPLLLHGVLSADVQDQLHLS